MQINYAIANSPETYNYLASSLMEKGWAVTGDYPDNFPSLVICIQDPDIGLTQLETLSKSELIEITSKMEK